jgi:hypothetical protein
MSNQNKGIIIEQTYLEATGKIPIRIGLSTNAKQMHIKYKPKKNQVILLRKYTHNVNETPKNQQP